MAAVPVRVGTFTPSLLLELGRHWGIFDELGLSVSEVPVSSSPAQFEMLESGALDYAFTSPDNALAYRFVRDNPLGRTVSTTILRGVDRGLGLSLCLRPGLNASAPLSVKVFGVDVPQSGFAFAGYRLLELGGAPRSSYETSSLGATPGRVEVLSRGACDATMLDAGFEVHAAAAGATIQSPVAALGPYVATVLVAPAGSAGERAKVEEHTAPVLVEAVDAVIERILDTRFRSDVLMVSAALRGFSPEQAATHYETIRQPDHGFLRDGAVDDESMDTVIGLRERYLPSHDLVAARSSYRTMFDS